MVRFIGLFAIAIAILVGMNWSRSDLKADPFSTAAFESGIDQNNSSPEIVASLQDDSEISILKSGYQNLEGRVANLELDVMKMKLAESASKKVAQSTSDPVNSDGLTPIPDDCCDEIELSESAPKPAERVVEKTVIKSSVEAPVRSPVVNRSIALQDDRKGHWTHPGRIEDHLASDMHGVDTTGLSREEMLTLHDKLHEGTISPAEWNSSSPTGYRIYQSSATQQAPMVIRSSSVIRSGGSRAPVLSRGLFSRGFFRSSASCPLGGCP